ncbi:hypothetical protein ABKN59_003115 [Abortiporus biennis]
MEINDIQILSFLSRSSYVDHKPQFWLIYPSMAKDRNATRKKCDSRWCLTCTPVKKRESLKFEMRTVCICHMRGVVTVHSFIETSLAANETAVLDGVRRLPKSLKGRVSRARVLNLSISHLCPRYAIRKLVEARGALCVRTADDVIRYSILRIPFIGVFLRLASLSIHTSNSLYNDSGVP